MRLGILIITVVSFSTAGLIVYFTGFDTWIFFLLLFSLIVYGIYYSLGIIKPTLLPEVRAAKREKEGNFTPEITDRRQND